MWRSSRNRTAPSARRRSRRGFSLIELLVSLAIFLVVIMVPMYLLFTMRNYAERQQYTIVPRQTARRALDYVSYYLEGASDLNSFQNNPNAIVTWYNSNAANANSREQASYNNLTSGQAGAGYGDEGTDIVTLAIPTSPMKVPLLKTQADGAGRTFQFGFRGGCGVGNDNTANMDLFKTITGGSPAAVRSGILAAVDNSGEWNYLVITTYQASDCASVTSANITVLADPGMPPAVGGPIDPPGGHVLLADPAALIMGLQFVSFRVRNGNLEQKNGIFFPVAYPPGAGNADTPGTAFFPVMENVEDLQVAYMYADGTIWNTAGQTLSMAGECGPCTGNVPWQQHTRTFTPPVHDISNVVGLRLSVVARSAALPLGVRKMTTLKAGPHVRPAVEDRAAGTADNFEHYRITTTLMLRNRMLGS